MHADTRSNMCSHADMHTLTSQAMVISLNWAAPSTTKGADADQQAMALASLVHMVPKSIGLVLMPQFTYKRGSLYMSETEVYARFKTKALNFDRHWSLLFDMSSRSDPRDGRPLVYDGRFVHASAAKEKDVFFAQSKLWKARRHIWAASVCMLACSCFATRVAVITSPCIWHDVARSVVC